MSDDDTTTRRATLTSAGAAAASGLLAGCSGGTAETAPTDTASGSYEACIEPVGCQTFDAVPETYACYNGAWADMAFALGQRDGFLTAGNMIPGFFFDPFDLDVPAQDDLTALWSDGSWDKETFYELNPDVFLIDPEFLEQGWDDSWGEADTEEIRENVAPFFGNNCRRRREFHDYRLYTLYEAFDRLADLFQERDRYDAFATLHEAVQSDIESRLPPASERPTVGLINGGSDPSTGEFYPLDTQSEGYEMKPYRDLNVESAFPDTLEGGSIDYEQLLEVDPEILVVHWGIGTTGETGTFSADAFREQYVTPMEEDSVGSQLTAVQSGNVYPGQYGEQGPIVNLLQTEMVAQQLYPDEFGAFDPESFPDVPAENRLFDRDRVRDIVVGEL